VPKKARKGKGIKDDGTVEQLRFCAKVLQEISRKAYYAIASPFYEPVGKSLQCNPIELH
jgi:bromodomain-containing factor 1